MALRIAGFNCPNAEDRIRAPSVWKQLTSGSGRASASSRAGVVSPELLESSIGTSRIVRRFRSKISASLVARFATPVSKLTYHDASPHEWPKTFNIAFALAPTKGKTQAKSWIA